MKKIIHFFYLIFLTCSLSAQITSSCNVPSTLQTYYEKDVKHLAFQRISYQNSPYKDSINIPQSYQDTIWQGLAAIYNLTTVVERDSVFDKYCIHHYVCSIYNKIFVSVNTSYTWTQQWQNLNITTGITSLDNLLSAYGFTISSFSTFANYATLITSQNINVIPICDSIETYAGVNYAEFAPYYGDGNAIVYSKTGNDRFYHFSVGYGDCPSGCTSRHTYKFKVYDDCSVDYLGVFDQITPNDHLPSPGNCNITTGVENRNIGENVMLYPNPANDYIIIKTPEWSSVNYSITDFLGQVVKTGIFYNESEISIKKLTPGIYLVNCYNLQNRVIRSFKFIKK